MVAVRRLGLSDCDRSGAGGRVMKPFEPLTIDPANLPTAIEDLVARGGRPRMAYAWQPAPGKIELRYVASEPRVKNFIVWRCRADGPVPSVANIRPSLSWYEREITDLFGVEFSGQPEPYSLVLQQGAKPTAPPMLSEYPAGRRVLFASSVGPMPEIESPDVQRLPFGPIRADVLESAEFIFSYVGEHIIHYHPQLFFKHRGMEKRFEGRGLTHGVILAERVSAVGSVAHSLAFCQAVEQAARCAVPKRAAMLRSLLAELERLYNHLHYFGNLCNTTTLKVGEAEGKLLEERAKQINAKLTGSRFLRGVLKPGGLRRDLNPEPWLSEALEALREDVAKYLDMLENTNSHLDRLITTGVLEKRVAQDQGATGPIARASGVDLELRRDHPYAAYHDLPLTVLVKTTGDAHARAQVRMGEIDASFTIMQRILLLLAEGPIASECSPFPNSEGLGWAESPRGAVFYAVHFRGDGTLGRVKIKSPSFSNWRAFPFTVHDTNMMDYAINEASFGLTIAGCDR
jgi:formate hydrogenlyase subunit 5